MKKTLVSFGALALVGMAGAAGFAEEYPDAQKTLPGSMGWMQGFPPAQEKTLHASDGSFFEFPALRYSVNHMREFFPTRNVSSGNGKKYSVKVPSAVSSLSLFNLCSSTAFAEYTL